MTLLIICQRGLTECQYEYGDEGKKVSWKSEKTKLTPTAAAAAAVFV